MGGCGWEGEVAGGGVVGSGEVGWRPLRGSRHGLRGGLLRRGHIRWSGLQYQPDAQRRLVIFRPCVGVFLGNVGGRAGGGFHQIAADIAGFDPRRPKQHRRRRGEVDAVAGFSVFQKPQGKIRLPLADS